ncbi:hypothetical protein PHLCEN_2v13404 [Hermanssonia centrifuga]|uniref:Uncharacterized protein n=1 Tax=Hermanssonia centrifuga TaxID=98765 RepID=A0A2R6NEF3_9APHY|nr:hypothetical protein PHLCEN_2v13404 [Hermanssonia centrifuga]
MVDSNSNVDCDGYIALHHMLSPSLTNSISTPESSSFPAMNLTYEETRPTLYHFPHLRIDVRRLVRKRDGLWPLLPPNHPFSLYPSVELMIPDSLDLYDFGRIWNKFPRLRFLSLTWELQRDTITIIDDFAYDFVPSYIVKTVETLNIHLRCGYKECLTPKRFVKLLDLLPNVTCLRINVFVFLKDIAPHLPSLKVLILDAPPFYAGRQYPGNIMGWNVAAGLRAGLFHGLDGTSPARIIIESGRDKPLGWGPAAKACARCGVEFEHRVIYDASGKVTFPEPPNHSFLKVAISQSTSKRS